MILNIEVQQERTSLVGQVYPLAATSLKWKKQQIIQWMSINTENVVRH